MQRLLKLQIAGEEWEYRSSDGENWQQKGMCAKTTMWDFFPSWGRCAPEEAPYQEEAQNEAAYRHEL